MGERKGWRPAPTKHDWRAYLTEDEAAEVRNAERELANARYLSAMWAPVLNLIRNRATHRAIHAKARAEKPS